jgi:transposase
MEEMRTGDGHPIPPLLRAEVNRLRRRLVITLEMIREVEAECEQALQTQDDSASRTKGGAVSKSPMLLLDDDTIRGWRKLFEQRGIEGLTSFDVGGSASCLTAKQEDDLTAWAGAALPRSTRQIGAWIEKEFGLVYESRSGLIALLHRLGLAYHKPDVIPRKLDEAKQKAFIESYDKLLNSMGDNEAVVFADAVHPTHAARPAGCWAPGQEKLAIEQTSGRQRINIHGAIDLETGQTQMIEALTIDAASTIRLLESTCSSMSFSTTRAIIMPSSCGNGLPGRGAGSSCISSRPIART